jgi:type II secretory pathway predicted ATPase ExeA
VIEKLKSHYGFSKTPFGRALAPQVLHRHGAHAEAVARIDWCISERGLGVVTGEVGAGKTVAIRAALAGLDSSRNTVIYLGNPAVGGRGLYGCIVTALGGVPRFHKAALIPQTTDLLAAEEHERGRHTTVVLDEAHLLGADQLEELRLLTNAEMDSHSPFSCLLVGQPTLRRRIKLGTFAALDQRITLRYAMNGMTDTETAGYIAHDAAPAVMRRGRQNRLACKGVTTRTVRIIQSCSRNARSLSGGRYRPWRTPGGAVRAMAFSLSAMWAWR